MHSKKILNISLFNSTYKASGDVERACACVDIMCKASERAYACMDMCVGAPLHPNACPPG